MSTNSKIGLADSHPCRLRRATSGFVARLGEYQVSPVPRSPLGASPQRIPLGNGPCLQSTDRPHLAPSRADFLLVLSGAFGSGREAWVPSLREQESTSPRISALLVNVKVIRSPSEFAEQESRVRVQRSCEPANWALRGERTLGRVVANGNRIDTSALTK